MKIWSGSAAPESGNEAYRIMLEKDIDVDKYLIPYEILSFTIFNNLFLLLSIEWNYAGIYTLQAGHASYIPDLC